jgi:AraC-like DNA-binding protein
MLTKIYTKGWTDDSEWIINTPSEMARESFYYVQEIGHFYCLPDFFTLHENIASFFVSLTLSGECEYTYQKKTYTLKKGDLIFVDCKEHHTLQLKSSKKWDMIWIQFNGSNAYAYYNQYVRQKKSIINIGNNDSIYALLNQMIELNRTKSAYCELLNSKYITDMLTELMILSGSVLDSNNYMPDYIKMAINDIDTHFMDDLSLDYFARVSCISKFHFLKEFKKYTGFTPYNYLQMVRINNAKRMLKYSDTSICNIAEEAGFNNVPNFFVTFKNKTGMTPLQFRNGYETELK